MVPLRPVVNRALYVSLCRPCVTAHPESVLPSCSQMPSRIHRIIGDFFSPIHGTHRIMKFYTSTWQFVLSKTMGKYMAGAAFLFFCFLGGGNSIETKAHCFDFRRVSPPFCFFNKCPGTRFRTSYGWTWIWTFSTWWTSQATNHGRPLVSI